MWTDGAIRSRAGVDEKVLELIATIPEAKRTLAWAAAKRIYLQRGRMLGYDEHGAEDWASEIISRLQIAYLLRKA
jgi:hypothetical protein